MKENEQFFHLTVEAHTARTRVCLSYTFIVQFHSRLYIYIGKNFINMDKENMDEDIRNTVREELSKILQASQTSSPTTDECQTSASKPQDKLHGESSTLSLRVLSYL